MLRISKTRFLAIGIVVLAAAWLAAGPLVADTDKCGHITEDETWGPPEDTVYIVCPQGVYIDPGVTVTVLPGVTVKFLSGTSFLQVDGTLSAVGTEVDKILFTSSKTAPKAGDWSQILFTPTSQNCEMTHCEIAWGGSFGYPMVVSQSAVVPFANCSIHDALAALVYASNGSILTITDCSVDTCGGAGVDCDDESALTMTGTTVGNCMLSGVKMDGGALVLEGCTLKDNKEAAGAITGTMTAVLCTNNTATGNDLNGLVVTLCQVPGTATITSTGTLPLVVGGDTTTAGLTFPVPEASITIAQGSIVKFLDSDYSRIYCAASLVVAGTEAEPIVFTSIHDDTYGGDTDAAPISPSPGDWSRVEVANVPNVRHAIFAYGGAGGDFGQLHCTSAGDASISWSSFAWSAGHGVFCSSSSRPTITACAVTASGRHGIYCAGVAWTTNNPVVTDCMVTDSGGSGIRCYYYTYSSGNPAVTGCVVGGSQEYGIGCTYGYYGGSATITACTVLDSQWGIYCPHGDPTVTRCVVSGCWEDGVRCGGTTVTITDCGISGSGKNGISSLGAPSPTIALCTVSGSGQRGLWVSDGAASHVSDCVVCGTTGSPGHGVVLENCAGTAQLLTSCDNVGSGVYCTSKSPLVNSGIFVHNGRYGVESDGIAWPTAQYSCFWENALGSMSHEFPGAGDFVADPLFVDEEEDDYGLLCDSPCIDTADPNLPWVDGTYVDRGGIQFGGWLYAPDPEPYCSGPLFGPGPHGYPSWVWFSVPFDAQWDPDGGTDFCCENPDPTCGDPMVLLSFDCGGTLYSWDKYLKAPRVYQPPFTRWDLKPGDSYLLLLMEDPGWVYYKGRQPDLPFEFKIGRQGWTWVGMPRGAPLAGATFMSSVAVRYPSDEMGEVRTAQADYDAIPNNWLAWSWAFYDTSLQAPKAFTPYAPFGYRDCQPWIGYRAWVRVGTALDEEDPHQITLIWPGF